MEFLFESFESLIPFVHLPVSNRGDRFSCIFYMHLRSLSASDLFRTRPQRTLRGGKRRVWRRLSIGSHDLVTFKTFELRVSPLGQVQLSNHQPLRKKHDKSLLGISRSRLQKPFVLSLPALHISFLLVHCHSFGGIVRAHAFPH